MLLSASGVTLISFPCLFFCSDPILFFFSLVFLRHCASVELPRVSAVLDTFLDCLESFEQGSAAASSSSDPSSASDAQAKLLNPRALGAAVEWVAAMVQGQSIEQHRT